MSRALISIAWCIPLLLACGGSTASTSGGGTTTAGSSGTTSTGGSTGTGSSTGGGSTTGSTGGAGTASTGGGTGDGGVVTGAPCTPNASPDPCLAIGLACSQAGTCQYPQELQQCLAAVGCAATLQCTPGYQFSGATVSICLHPCSATSDCPNPITNCQAHSGGASATVCFLNFCGSGTTGFYQPCNSAGSADGVCLPAGMGASGEVGVCEAGGTLPPWSLCSVTRGEDGGPGFCDLQASCIPFVGATGPAVSVCTPFCAPTGSPVSGPACAAGETCFPSPLGGFCLQDCGSATAPACPTNLFCGMYPGPSGPAAECLP